MTAGADRALEVTSGTESFAAGVPVVGRHQLVVCLQNNRLVLR